MTERKNIVKALALLLATVMTVVMLPGKMQVVDAATCTHNWVYVTDSTTEQFCTICSEHRTVPSSGGSSSGSSSSSSSSSAAVVV